MFAQNVRKLMGKRLGAELSLHGIKEQQALKHNGIYVDWSGRLAAVTMTRHIVVIHWRALQSDGRHMKLACTRASQISGLTCGKAPHPAELM